MNILMRISVVAFVVSLIVLGVIRSWNALLQYWDYRYLDYGQHILATMTLIAFAIGSSAGIIMLGLLVFRAWGTLERLGE